MGKCRVVGESNPLRHQDGGDFVVGETGSWVVGWEQSEVLVVDT